MKIDEFIKRVNETLYAMWDPFDKAIKIYESRQTYNDEEPGCDYSFMTLFPDKDDLAFGFNSDDIVLGDISFRNLAILFGLVQQLRDTPIKERFPEKKYRLRWIDSNDGRDDEFIGPETYLGRSEDNGVLYWTTFQKFGAEIFTESELEQLKKDNPRFAPAIDAMKEEVKDDE